MGHVEERACANITHTCTNRYDIHTHIYEAFIARYAHILTHKCTQMRAHTHVHIQKHTITRSHTHAQIKKHTHAHTHTHTHIDTQTHVPSYSTHTHTHPQAHTSTLFPLSLSLPPFFCFSFLFSFSSSLSLSHTRMHIRMHKHTNTHTPSHTHNHIHTPDCAGAQGGSLQQGLPVFWPQNLCSNWISFSYPIYTPRRKLNLPSQQLLA